MRRNRSYNTSSEGISSAKKSVKISFISGIVACLCIVVYLGSMVFAGIQVYTGIIERRALAAKEFSSLLELSATIGVLEFFIEPEPFSQTVTNAIIKSRTLQGVIISSQNRKYPFERNAGTIITQDRDSLRFKSQFGLSKEPLVKELEIRDDLQQVQRVIFSAVYTYIDDELLITILKRTLLVVLATLCLALFTLIFQFLVTNPTGVNEEVPYNQKVETFRENRENRETVQDIDEAPSPQVTTDPPSMPAPASAPVLMEETKGLYGSRSYIGEESRTQDRLNTELKRCTSFGQDLVFMVIGINEEESAQTKDKGFRLLADEAVKFFLRRDLIFEKGEQGITVILPSVDLDQGFAKSEKFHNRIINKYAEAFECPVELYIGLSSRADRIIDAERLLFEASGALKKAWEDPASPIVAFKSDPEKYKAFIAAQNKSQP